MNKRIWGVIIIAIGVLLLAVIIYFVFFYKFSPSTPTVNQPTAQPAATVLPSQGEVKSPATIAPVSPLKKAEVQSEDLARMAAAFAERFGSFSNQSDFGNLRDLQIFMTAKMKAWAQNYVSQARARKTDTSIYYGIVTKAVLSQAKQFDQQAGQAEILVKTQRRESSGFSANGATFYQDIVIKCLREDGVWRVDEATWQTR